MWLKETHFQQSQIIHCSRRLVRSSGIDVTALKQATPVTYKMFHFVSQLAIPRVYIGSGAGVLVSTINPGAGFNASAFWRLWRRYFLRAQPGKLHNISNTRFAASREVFPVVS